MRYFIILGCVVCQMVMSHCSLDNRKSLKGISRKDASLRASFVSHIHYDLEFKLDGKDSDFSGKVDIHFDLRQKKEGLRIDFREGKIFKLFVNQRAISKPDYNDLYLSIPQKDLNVGGNLISIQFGHPYSKTGDGLYRFKDPEDGRVYLYSNFEPYDANLMFPCFDQPNLKATYELSVEVPSDWRVITSVFEDRIQKMGRNRKIMHFPKSALFSTYIFSLHAGPYKMWESNAGSIPLRLFARRSFSKYVKPEEWFVITQQGLQFYQDYFDFPYPFKKYDQLVVPDFNSGAMENVAAVTFNESYMPRGEWTQNERENIAEVILHEMAHMWFGNLVTMRWWDDLWLNESFASYMATLATHEATEFKKSWQSFYDGMKQWAYWEDQLVTTHPIVAEVPDTEQAFANFDGITYGKGASVLKQLSYFIGPTNFKNGVQNYFKKYAFQNTEMKDFVDALASEANMDLTEWTERWLKKEGLNLLTVDYRCDNGKIDSLRLLQSTSSKQPSFRHHRTQMGLYDLQDGQVVLRKSIPITYRGKSTTVSDLKGEGCPLIIYPNHEDYDYVKVRLDPQTLEASQLHLSKITDPFVRMMLWQSLWDMVRDAHMPVQKYAQLLFKNLPLETDIKTATRVAGRIKTMLYYFPMKTPYHHEMRTQYVGHAEMFLWKLLGRSKPKSDFQKLWFDTFVDFARTPEAQKKLVAMLKNNIRFLGLKIDQDRRWKIIIQLHQFDGKEARLLRDKELKKDPSEKGKKMALAAEVSIPRMTVKKEWFSKISSEKTNLSLARLRTAMTNLFPPHQDDFRISFAKVFFRTLVKLSDKKEGTFLSSYTASLAPAICTPQSVSALKKFISTHAKLQPIILKRLRIAHQEDERCLKIRSLAQNHSLVLLENSMSSEQHE